MKKDKFIKFLEENKYDYKPMVMLKEDAGFTILVSVKHKGEIYDKGVWISRDYIKTVKALKAYLAKEEKKFKTELHNMEEENTLPEELKNEVGQNYLKNKDQILRWIYNLQSMIGHVSNLNEKELIEEVKKTIK